MPQVGVAGGEVVVNRLGNAVYLPVRLCNNGKQAGILDVIVNVRVRLLPVVGKRLNQPLIRPFGDHAEARVHGDKILHGAAVDGQRGGAGVVRPVIADHFEIDVEHVAEVTVHIVLYCAGSRADVGGGIIKMLGDVLFRQCGGRAGQQHAERQQQSDCFLHEDSFLSETYHVFFCLNRRRQTVASPPSGGLPNAPL